MYSKKNKNDIVVVVVFFLKGFSVFMQFEMEEKNKIIDMQKLEIKRLRMEIIDIEMGFRFFFFKDCYLFSSLLKVQVELIFCLNYRSL